MGFTLGLAGDAMLGRKVGERLRTEPPESLVAPEVVAAAREADLFVLNLECCVSERGSPWPEPAKPFFFRAPPAAVEVLLLLGVDCVTLANNHALDYGPQALLDTIGFLDEAGIGHVGAGADEDAARAPALLEAEGCTLGVVGVADHPADFAAGPDRPGTAYADLARADGVLPPWVPAAIAAAAEASDAVLVTPHWGPNMQPEPVPHVRATASALLDAGATLVAGHSAHVFQGVAGRVLFDLGDFLDDYAVDAVLRNDLGLLWLVSFEGGRPFRIEAVPLRLDFCHTRPAGAEDAGWIRERLRERSAPFGTDLTEEAGRLVIEWPGPPPGGGP